MKKHLLAFAVTAVPGAAFAQSVGVGGSPCSFTSISAAVASLGSSSGTIFVRAGMVHSVPNEITLNAHHTITASTADCTAEAPGMATVAAGGTERIFRVARSKQVELRNLRLKDGIASDGGNIYVESFGKITLDNTWVSFGVATDDGGSIFLEDDADLIMKDGAWIRGSTAEQGGGVFANHNSVVRMMGGSIIGDPENPNEAVQGGGIFAFRSELDIETQSLIQFNEAELSGGGVQQIGSDTTIWGDFVSNVSGGGGGGLSIGFGTSGFNDTVAVNAASSFIDNVAAGGGGAIGTSETGDSITLTVNLARFEGNEAGGGGAIAVNDGATFEMTGGSFYDNVASGSGGAILGHGDSLEVDGTYFEGNAALDGGAIAVHDEGSIAMIQGTFVESTAGNRGGAIRVFDGTAQVFNATFEDNVAQAGGGAIYVGGPDSLLRIAAPSGESCVLSLGCAHFEGNSTVTATGGAIWINASAEAIVRRSVMQFNSAPAGSAVSMTGGTLTLTGSRIGRNTDAPGAINAAIDVTAGDVTVTNNTILDNSRGGARFDASVSGDFDNNIVFFNLGGVLPGGVSTACNDTQGGALTGPNNISVVPSFNPNGSLQVGSAGIDACPSSLGKAIDGTIRPIGTGPTPHDMGCFEQ